MNKYLARFGLFVVLLLASASHSSNAEAQLFSDENNENWKKVFHELRKINSRLVKLETSEMVSFRHQFEDLLRQIEQVKQTLPQLQGSVELNKSETLAQVNKVVSKMSDLKEGLARDMEYFEKVNKENFQNFASGHL